MAAPIQWTPEMEARIVAGRAARETWDTIGVAVGVSRNAVIDRGKRLLLAGGRSDLAAIRLPSRPAAVKPPAPPNFEERPPLCAGHPVAWGAITDGTLLDGAPYPFPVYA